MASRNDRTLVRRYLAREAAGLPIEPTLPARPRFGEFLVTRGAISRVQLLRVLVEHSIHGDRLGSVVVGLGMCPHWRVELLALQYHRYQQAVLSQGARLSWPDVPPDDTADPTLTRSLRRPL
ncbi:MAG TPA: hypothetical protein VKN99_11585 [Polyangia bacterium]|nr:hypothetical protein [Polyangia bacterium]